jgi:thioredoxin 1
MFEELTDKDIYDRAISAEKPAVVVFYKPGSEKNQELFDLLAKFRAIYGDKVNFFAMNAEENTTPEDLGIFYFPTVLYFRDTMELERHDYIPTEEEVETAIRRLLRL